MDREAQRWPVRGFNFRKELLQMHLWLQNRAQFLGNLIENIPEPGSH